MQFFLTVLRGGVPLPYPFRLMLKLIQYFLIADITILFCEMETDAVQINTILSGFILLMYFIGKVQKMKFRFMIVQVQGQQVPQEPPNMNLEFGVIALSMALFIFLLIQPQYAENPLSHWFYRTITDIEKNAFFGFIFQVVGFFFTIGILLRLINAFTFILSGKAFAKQPNDHPNDDRRNDKGFDDYEEVE